MADTVYKRMDADQVLFLSNLIFQYMKGSVLNTQYTLAPNSAGTAWELKASVNGGTPSVVATISAASAQQAGLLSATFYTKLDGVEAGAQVNKLEGIKVNGVAQTIDGNKIISITVPTKTSDLTNDSTFQTKAQIEALIAAQISSTYQPGGSVAFASLPALSADKLGFVYNVTDAFTTNANFVEGAGKSFPGGTDVAIINTGTAASPVYKYNVLAGFIDLSDYVQASQMATLSNAEITTAVSTAYTSVFGS